MTHQQALDTMAAERYLLDEMPEVEKHQFEEHFFDCDDCAEEVRRGELIRQEVRRAKSQPRRNAGLSLVAPRRPVWRRPMAVLPWAAAATLALTTGYQSLVVVPTLERANAPQSLSPVMLREATRGAVPVVKVSREQRFVTLGLDVTAPAKEATYDLLDQAGVTILSGRTSLPPSGAPLFLLIPADELGRQGRYTLVVRDTASPGATSSEYGFDVAY
jgi:anti-sigma factor RsiW